MNVTVTGWLRWLSTGSTPEAEITTVGSVRGWEGSSKPGLERFSTEAEPHAPISIATASGQDRRTDRC